MSEPSHWKLTADAVRCIIPLSWVDEMKQHPLTENLYPTSFGFYSRAADHFMERDSHNDSLLLCCLEGRAFLEVGDSTYHIKKGDLLILPSGLNHKYWSDNDDPWSVYWVHFDGNKADDFILNLNRPDNSPVWALGLKSRVIADFLILLETRNRAYQLDSFLYASSVLRQMLSFLGQIAMDPDQARLNIDEVHVYMQKEINQQLDLDELASHFNMSRFHFAKIFRELSGTSPISYFISLKMKQACHILDTSNQSIGEISDELGYSDAYYFSRIFKQKTGYSPKNYRLSNKG